MDKQRQDLTRELNLLTNPNFMYVIEELPGVNLMSQSFELPAIQFGQAPVTSPFIDYNLPGEKVQFTNFNCTFLVDENLHNYYEVWKWMMQLGFPRAFKQYRQMLEDKKYKVKSDIHVIITTNKMNQIEVVRFHGCFPVSLSEIMFSHTDSSVSHPQCTVIFSYDYFTFEYLDDTMGKSPFEGAIKQKAKEAKEANDEYLNNQ